MSRIASALERVNRVIGGAVCWCALVMVLLQFTVVLLRYVFGFSSIAMTESVLYLHATLFMLGAGYTLLVGGHVRVDIFHSRLPARGKALVDVFGHLCLLFPSVVVLAYWSWPSVRNAWAILEGPISVGGIPASFLLKSLVPAFCVLLAVQGVAALLRDVESLTGRATSRPGGTSREPSH